MDEHRKKSWVKAALRRASYKWPARWEARKASKIGRNQYVCAECEGVFGNKEVQMDHIIPIAPDGWDWNGLIERLFCDASGWQVLCRECHRLKTKRENIQRPKRKRKKKAKKKRKKKVK